MGYISLREIRKTEERDKYLRKGPFILNLLERRVQLHRNEIPLTPCTFAYLATLLRHAPNPVSYDILVNESAGFKLTRLEAQDMARWRIWLLRKALEVDPNHPRWIRAVAGVGYRLAL